MTRYILEVWNGDFWVDAQLTPFETMTAALLAGMSYYPAYEVRATPRRFHA